MKRQRYYHKYFEDYREDVVPNPNGKGVHREYTYEGYYYRQELSGAGRLLLRVCYVLLFGLQLYFFGRGGLQASVCNLHPAVVICQGLNLLCTIWIAWILIFYVTAPRYMTVYQYKSTAVQLARAQKLSAASGLLLFGTAAAVTLAEEGVNAEGLFGSTGAYAAAALLGIVWMITEMRIRYRRLPNHAKEKDGSTRSEKNRISGSDWTAKCKVTGGSAISELPR